MGGKPDAVICLVEDVAITVKVSRRNRQDDSATMPTANTKGGFWIRRKMDLLTSAWLQTFLKDVIQICPSGSVVECFGRCRRRKIEIDREGVPLGGANSPTISRYREPLLVIAGNQIFEIGSGHRPAGCLEGAQKIFDPDPAMAIEFDPDRFGMVAQDIGEKLAGSAHTDFPSRGGAGSFKGPPGPDMGLQVWLKKP